MLFKYAVFFISEKLAQMWIEVCRRRSKADKLRKKNFCTLHLI